jgi:hypothetical protein
VAPAAGRSASPLGASMHCRRGFLIVIFGLVGFSGCSNGPDTRTQTVSDPITGQPVEVRISTIGDVEVLVPTGESSTVLFYVKGRPIASTMLLGDHRITDILDRKFISVATVESLETSGEPLSIKYGHAGWLVIDENFDGQLDTRGSGKPVVTDVWLDGKWQRRATSGEGKERRYFVGDKEVALTSSGWVFASK